MKSSIIIFLILSVFITNCIRKIHNLDNALIKDGKYDSEFSNIPVSARGISGGPIFAIRDGVPNFEFVGIVKAIAERKTMTTLLLMMNMMYQDMISHGHIKGKCSSRHMKWSIMGYFMQFP
jgi:hypothetical protein